MNTKKIFLIVSIFVLLVTSANAQLRFGIKGGANFDNFNYDFSSATSVLKNSTGWQAGILLQFKVPIVGISMQPELLYTVKNAKIDGSTNSIKYFEVPVNLQWGFNFLLLRPYIMLGPYFSYAANFSGNIFKNNLDRFDWGIGLGAGIEIWKLQLALRYAWGLQNVSKVKDFDMKNKTLSLSLGLLF